ncbi:MAG: hypothetical protein IJX47_01985 [Clostridia bacterium]|nr:hypothetical protein [Clostridia bacterium]
MKHRIKRIIIYLMGLFILSLGVAVSVKSGLGVTSVNSIPYALSLIFSADMGVFTAGLYILFVLIQALLLRRKFQKRYLLEIPCSVLFGGMVDLSNVLLTLFPDPSHYILRLMLLAVSILLVALGVYLYCGTNLIPLPGDGVIIAVADKCKIKFHTVKILFDCTLVVISAAISLIFLHGLVSVREGTVISSLLIGAVVGALTKIFGNHSTARE